MVLFVLIKLIYIYFFWDFFGVYVIGEIYGVDLLLICIMILIVNSFWILVFIVGFG